MTRFLIVDFQERFKEPIFNFFLKVKILHDAFKHFGVCELISFADENKANILITQQIDVPQQFKVPLKMLGKVHQE